jgi:predicted nuclease with TOPRIM domain
MKKLAQKALVLAVSIVAVAVLVTGCQEEKQPDTKTIIAKSRLKVLESKRENRQLRKEIENLKKQHKEEIKHQKNLLEKCQQEKKDLEESLSKGVDKYMEDVLGPLVDENAKLHEENENLKSQIRLLKKQLEELKKRPTIPDKPQPL